MMCLSGNSLSLCRYPRDNRKLCASDLPRTIIPDLCPLHYPTRNFSTSIWKELMQSVRKRLLPFPGKFREADVYFYSSHVDENRNRRYVTADNCASFVPHRRELHPISNEFADKEFASLLFLQPGTGIPLYGIGNFAAHPIAGHAPGLGGLRISADFPGAFRALCYMRRQVRNVCIFPEPRAIWSRKR